MLEPFWSVYVPTSPGYWANQGALGNPLLSPPFASPIYLLLAAACVVVGWHKAWLNAREILVATLLLAVPYLIQGYRNDMESQGRFAAVAFPVYIVMGQLMARAPRTLVAAIALVSGFLLATYAAEFAAWYRIT